MEFEANDPAQSRVATLLEEHRDDLDSIHVHTEWRQNQVIAEIRWRWFIALVLLIDAASRVGTQVETGGNAWVRGHRSTFNWNQDATMFYLASDSFDLADGLDVRAWNSSHLVIADQSGELQGLFNIANTCGEPTSEDILRHRAGWSPDGAWFAIGGTEDFALFACPDWEWTGRR